MRAKVKGLNQFLRERRINRGITQMEAAKHLGHTTPMYISNFERNLCEPSVETAVKLCGLYRVPRSTLKRVMVELFERELSKKLKAAA